MLVKHRGQLTELIPTEGTFVLANDDRVKATIRIGERGQQRRGAGPVGPRHAAGLPDIEVVRDDPAVPGDQLAGGLPLPAP
jgi:hypothetical protein